MGSPRTLTTRPSRPSPTGTLRISPVARTALALLDVVDVAEHHGADGLLVEVQGQADGAGLELEQLVDRGVGKSRDPGDAVTDLDDPSDLPTATSGVKPSRFFWIAAVMSAVLMVSSAMSGCSFARSVGSAVRVAQNASRSWLRRVRTDPSRRVSPIWVTTPPTTVGSTMLRTVTSAPCGGAECVGQAGFLVVGEGDGRAHLGHDFAPTSGGPLDESVDDRRRGSRPDRWRPPTTPATSSPSVARGPRRSSTIWARRSAGMWGSDSVSRELVVALDGPGEPEQLVLHVAGAALGGDDGHQGIGVRIDDGLAHVSSSCRSG